MKYPKGARVWILNMTALGRVIVEGEAVCAAETDTDGMTAVKIGGERYAVARFINDKAQPTRANAEAECKRLNEILGR